MAFVAYLFAAGGLLLIYRIIAYNRRGVQFWEAHLASGESASFVHALRKIAADAAAEADRNGHRFPPEMDLVVSGGVCPECPARH